MQRPVAIDGSHKASAPTIKAGTADADSRDRLATETSLRLGAYRVRPNAYRRIAHRRPLPSKERAMTTVWRTVGLSRFPWGRLDLRRAEPAAPPCLPLSSAQQQPASRRE